MTKQNHKNINNSAMKNIFRKLNENHILMMVICCLIPIVIAGVLFYFGLKIYAFIILMILCPILHYFMMRNMHKNNSNKIRKTRECH